MYKPLLIRSSTPSPSLVYCAPSAFGASIRRVSPANPIAMMLEYPARSSLIVQLLTSLVLFAAKACDPETVVPLSTGLMHVLVLSRP